MTESHVELTGRVLREVVDGPAGDRLRDAAGLPARKARRIRYSEIKKFMRCRRSWLNGYYYNLGTPEYSGDTKPSTASTGTLVHAALEHHYFTGGDPVEFLQAQEMPGGTYAADWIKTYTLATRMVEGYVEWLAETGEDAGEHTVGCEIELEVDMGIINGDPVSLVVHIDRLIYDATWNRWIIDDTKTVDSLKKGLEFDIDLQGLTYAWVVREALGITVAEFRHTMLRRVLRTAKAVPPFYHREPMTINAHQFAAQERHLRGVLCDMISVYQQIDADPSRHQDVCYPNPTKDCVWDCDFLPICGMHDDGSDIQGVRQALYVPRKSNQHSQATGA